MSAISYSRLPLWKYRTEAAYAIHTGIVVRAPNGGWVGNDYVQLHADGYLQIARHYAWDGPSGPTIDTRNWMRASLVHDALYQLLREGVLPQHMRLAADDLMYTHLREDGMSRIRAKTAWRAVRWFGEPHARKRNPPKVLVAP